MATAKKVKDKKPVKKVPVKSATQIEEDGGGIGGRPDDRNPPKKD
jgi:hypothetical protein